MKTTVLRTRKQILTNNDFSEDEYGAWLDTVVVNGVEITVDEFRKRKSSSGRRSRGPGIYRDKDRPK